MASVSTSLSLDSGIGRALASDQKKEEKKESKEAAAMPSASAIQSILMQEANLAKLMQAEKKKALAAQPSNAKETRESLLAKACIQRASNQFVKQSKVERKA